MAAIAAAAAAPDDEESEDAAERGECGIIAGAATPPSAPTPGSRKSFTLRVAAAADSIDRELAAGDAEREREACVVRMTGEGASESAGRPGEEGGPTKNE